MMLAIRRLLLTRTVEALLAKYGAVTVDSERGYDPDAKTFKDTGGVRKARGTINAAVKEALEFDEVWLMVDGNREDGYGGWVYVIFGNGNCDLDMVSDYSGSLEPVMAPIMRLAEGLSDGSVTLTV